MRKACTKCGETKLLSEFGLRRRNLDGLNTWCKLCCRANNTASYWRNAEKRRERSRIYRSQHPGHSTAHVRAWRERNPQAARALNQAYFDKRPGIRAKYAADRRAAQRRQTIKLSETHQAEISDFYERARRASAETGVEHHVDHQIPLMGVTVLGLHVPWNLQILTAEANRKKSNKVSL